jgi:hypothetical protein
MSVRVPQSRTLLAICHDAIGLQILEVIHWGHRRFFIWTITHGVFPWGAGLASSPV